MNFKSLSVVSFLCLLLMILGPRAGSAQQVDPLEPEWLQQMYAEGWEKMQEGVLRRDVGDGEFETFSYGAEGLQFVIEGYEQQLSFLEDRYNAAPSEDLAGVIEKLQGEIDKLSGNLVAASSAEAFDGSAMVECTDVAYGGQASAGPQASTRGVTASATAYFHTNCADRTGAPFAIAHAETVDPVTGLLTINEQTAAPNPGTWIDSSAVASTAGTSGCYSYAQASVTLNGESVFQTPRMENYACPLPVLATITGPATATADYYVNSGCVNVTWTASASQGNPAYTYQWYIGTALQGAGATLTKSYCKVSKSETVKVVATDTKGWQATKTFTTNVVYIGPLAASVTGPSSVTTNSTTPCANVTWTASVSGAHPGYTYSWYLGTGTTVLGTGSTYTKQYCNTNATVTAKVVVRDSDGHIVNATQDTTITHVDPLTASISGTQILRLSSPTQCVDLTWTAAASGGKPAYTYSWYLGTSTTVQGTGTTLTRRYCGAQGIDVKVTVRDSDAQTYDATFRTSLVYFTSQNCGNSPCIPNDL